jgi:hypothetical protein
LGWHGAGGCSAGAVAALKSAGTVTAKTEQNPINLVRFVPSCSMTSASIFLFSLVTRITKAVAELAAQALAISMA